MTEKIEYELRLPCNKAAERLAKTVGRILKHTYRCERLRIQHSKDFLVITAKVDRAHLNAIRGAVTMSMMARGLVDANGQVPKVKNIAVNEQKPTEGDGHSGARTPEALQAESGASEDEPLAIA